ncbi:unnamed protein product [Closterium sp. Naga37s-1]|nr:unnamed protein product [Closterium sp. Naga37s-1]
MGNSESRPADKRSRERASVVSGRSSNGSVAQLIARERSATVGSMMSSRRNPMIAAAAAGNVELVARLLASGVDRNGCCSTGKTPLMAAARGGHVAVVTLLLINDASLLRFDKTSARSCLHMAARAGSAECVEAVLVAAKASHELRNSWGYRRFVNARDATGCTALHLAAAAGAEGAVRVLLREGAAVSITTASTGHAPGNHALHMAARSGSVGTVLALLAWGADRTALNHSKMTPHALAVRAERERGWKARVEAGKNALAEKGVRAERRGSARAGGGKSGSGGASASAGGGGVLPQCDFKRVVALLNPKSPAPLVWPSPWAQLLARAPPQVVWLLRAALAQAGGEDAEGEGGGGQREVKGETEGVKGSGVKRREDGVSERLCDIRGGGGSGSRGGRCGVDGDGDGGGDVVREGWVEGRSGSRGMGMGAGTGGEVSEERGAHEALEHAAEQGEGGNVTAGSRHGEGCGGREGGGAGRTREEEGEGGESGECGRVDREMGEGVCAGVESGMGGMFEVGQKRMEEGQGAQGAQGGQGGEGGEDGQEAQEAQEAQGGVGGGQKQVESTRGVVKAEVEEGSAGEGGEGRENGSGSGSGGGSDIRCMVPTVCPLVASERWNGVESGAVEGGAGGREGRAEQQEEHPVEGQAGNADGELWERSLGELTGMTAQKKDRRGVRVMAREQVGRVEDGRRDGDLAVGDDGSRRGSGGEADGSRAEQQCHY